jgi:hypothetical protein
MLHDQEGRAVLAADVVERADVRVVQGPGQSIAPTRRTGASRYSTGSLATLDGIACRMWPHVAIIGW